MPTPNEEKLWKAIKEKRHDDIIHLIEKNPTENLINTVHPENRRSFLMHYIKISISQKFIIPIDNLKSLLLNPSLDWSYVNEETDESLAGILASNAAAFNDVTLIKLLDNIPGFLFSAKKLTYELAVENLEYKNITKNTHICKKAPKEVIDRDNLCIQAHQAVVSIIRDMTILYAIKHDDAALFGRLAAAGAKPTDFLGEFGDKELPSFLLTDANVKVRAWYAEQRTKALDSASSNTSSFFANAQKLQQVQQQVAQVEANHLARAAAIHQKAAAERTDRMQQAMTSF